MLLGKHAWKMDFNQCTGKQLIRGLIRAENKYRFLNIDLPFVLIGHSKLFTRANEKRLRPFLEYIVYNKQKYAFGTFHDINLNIIQNEAKNRLLNFLLDK